MYALNSTPAIVSLPLRYMFDLLSSLVTKCITLCFIGHKATFAVTLLFRVYVQSVGLGTLRLEMVLLYTSTHAIHLWMKGKSYNINGFCILLCFLCVLVFVCVFVCVFFGFFEEKSQVLRALRSTRSLGRWHWLHAKTLSRQVLATVCNALVYYLILSTSHECHGYQGKQSGWVCIHIVACSLKTEINISKGLWN